MPAGGDVEDINLVVMPAEDLGIATNKPSFDRIDIVATKDVVIDDLIDRVPQHCRPGRWRFRRA